MSSEKLGRDELRVPAHARDTPAVAAGRRDRARNVRAVIVAGPIEDGAVVVREVPAVDVVLVAVPVVIDAVGGVVSVGPDIRREIFVVVHDPFVDDPDVDVGSAGVSRDPRFRGL